MSWRAVVVLCLPLLTACGAERQTTVACPAIGWPATLAVHLAPGWVPGIAQSVELSCPDAQPCGIEVPAQDAEPTGPPPRELMAGTAEFDLLTGQPDEVEATVLGAGGEVLAVHGASLDWVRVGGTEECGGPSEAEVVVPAP